MGRKMEVLKRHEELIADLHTELVQVGVRLSDCEEVSLRRQGQVLASLELVSDGPTTDQVRDLSIRLSELHTAFINITNRLTDIERRQLHQLELTCLPDTHGIVTKPSTPEFKMRS